MSSSIFKHRQEQRSAPECSVRAWLCSTSLVVLIGAMAPTPVLAQTVWTGTAGGNWFDPGNWSAGVPNGSTDVHVATEVPNYPAIFNLGAAAQAIWVGVNGGDGRLSIILNGTLDTHFGTIGMSAGETGYIGVSGVNTGWTNTSSIFVGSAGDGTLRIDQGGRVNSQQDYVGFYAGGQGLTYVDGLASSWSISQTLHMGYGGYGGLTISNGGKVNSLGTVLGFSAGGEGVISVSDTGSTLTTTGTLAIAREGKGSLTVAAGGKTINVDGIIGGVAGSEGRAHVEGLGSQWTNTGVLQVGDGGQGTLTVKNRGTVTSITAGIGNKQGGVGKVVVDGIGANWQNSGYVDVGYEGSGAVEVINGGFISSGYTNLATEVGSTGTVTVQGIGSKIDVTHGLSVGYLGSGALDITNGGVVESESGVIANSVGSNGDVVVSGSGSAWNVTGNLTIGSRGDGALTVTGAGAGVTAGGAVVVGRADKGALNVLNGAVVTSLGGDIGRDAGGDGTAVVSGPGSKWDTGGGVLTVGAGGPGSLTVSNGGVVDGPVQVAANGVLGGNGAVGATDVLGGTLLGVQGETLRIDGHLALQSDATVNVALSAPGNSSGLFKVNGDLTLDGTLNVADAGGFGMGVYRIVDYTGSLTNNGMNVGNLPTGTSGTVQTAIANQVNLVVDSSGPIPTTQFWNGTTTTADGTIHGGNGSWVMGPSNWTNASGSAAAAWGGNFAIFQTNAGLVTVDNQAGAVSTTGMQFIGDGWYVGGQPLTLNGAGGSTTVRVGDGTLAGSGWSATVASELTGNSRLVKDDLGTLILTGTNSYTGGTTIAAGTLQIGDVGTSGSITGDLLNNGLLRFSRTDATTFGGPISGSGAVHVAHGQLTLTGDNTYTGTTTIGSVASLTLGNGGTTGSVAGNIVNSGLLRFNRSNDFTYAGEITGFGAIRQIGSGKTELTGNSSAFTGTTTVENGTLAVNGQLGSSLDVWTGGRLQGTGTVGNTVVSGVIAPGNSIGTINVANITFNAGSIYEVEVNAAGQSDKIFASGTATINGGSVQVLAGAGNYSPATTYTILTTTGGCTGTFTGGVTSNLAFLDPSLSYDANNVYLTMTRNDILFQNVGITPNQIAAGGGGESLSLGNPVYDALLNLSAPQAQYAFDQLSGELHASAKTAMLEDSRFIRNAVNDRIRAAFDGVGAANGNVVTYDNGKPRSVAANTDDGAVWGHAFGAWGHWNGDGNAARLDRSISGFFVGADAPAFDTWRFGAVAGYSRTSFNAKDRQSSGTSDNYHVGLYGGTAWGDLAFRTGAAYTWHDISTNRSVIFPGFGNSLTGDYGASTAQVFGELGYRMQAGNVAFEPFANLAYVNLHTEGFTEKGGAAALTSGSSSTDATFTTLGLRAASSFNLGETVVTAKGMVGWRHAFGDVTPDSMMRFAGGGNAFTIGGVPIARNPAVVEAGLDFALSPTTTLGVSYGGQFGSGVVDQSVRANFNVKF